MKNYFYVFLLSILSLSGCWDSKELNEIGIVTGIAIDRDQKTEEIILTQQTLNPATLNIAIGAPGPNVKNHESRGNTIFEAVRDGTQDFDRKKFFNHNKIIIINEKVAREGVLSILDVFIRDHEGRGLTLLSIARGVEARELLAEEPQGIGRYQAIHLEEMMENYRYNQKSSKVNIINFFEKELEEGINPVMGVLEKEETNAKLTGIAIFKKDKLIGYLDEIETRGYNWVIGEIHNAAITMPSLKNENELVLLETLGGDSRIIPNIAGNEISFTIESRIEVSLAEQQSKEEYDPYENLEYLKQVENKTKKVIEKEMKMAIEKVQKEYQADIFGFGRQLFKENPSKWKEVKENWDEIFSNAAYTIKIDVDIKHTGLIQGSFSSEE
ncbi:Ger(x)C family spore germination protein [Halalkalibacter flavus]|uniref:Ger(x)C family spore germination protein n=1 Tax=Halalkalibacter flavus TaxID=3090668 RepID=UPI002FC875CD